MSSQSVSVKVCSFIDLITTEAIYPININTYQRPYVWGGGKFTASIRICLDQASFAENC